MVEGTDRTAAAYPAEIDAYIERLQAWKDESARAEAEGKAISRPPTLPTDPRGMPTRPTGLFNAMIAPQIPYAIKGAIWYQGETNAMAPGQYYKLFPAMIRSWRSAWGRGDFPFLFVQLANFAARGGGTHDRSWAELREAQLMTLAEPNTAMAVAADVGESLNIHPRNKQAVGHRLALGAQAVAYGQKIVYSGPIYKSCAVEGERIRVRFDHVGGGLMAKDDKGELTAGAALKTFEIAGADRRFHPAEAKIDGDTVVVWAGVVKQPVAARYAFTNDPVGCNLYNKEELPASPFRTDNWDARAAAAE